MYNYILVSGLHLGVGITAWCRDVHLSVSFFHSLLLPTVAHCYRWAASGTGGFLHNLCSDPMVNGSITVILKPYAPSDFSRRHNRHSNNSDNMNFCWDPGILTVLGCFHGKTYLIRCQIVCVFVFHIRSLSKIHPYITYKAARSIAVCLFCQVLTTAMAFCRDCPPNRLNVYRQCKMLLQELS